MEKEVTHQNVVLNKNEMMSNVQKVDHCINIPSSETKLLSVVEIKKFTRNHALVTWHGMMAGLWIFMKPITFTYSDILL
jgi:hypothetical protein